MNPGSNSHGPIARRPAIGASGTLQNPGKPALPVCSSQRRLHGARHRCSAPSTPRQMCAAPQALPVPPDRAAFRKDPAETLPSSPFFPASASWQTAHATHPCSHAAALGLLTRALLCRAGEPHATGRPPRPVPKTHRLRLAAACTRMPPCSVVPSPAAAAFRAALSDPPLPTPCADSV